MNKSHFQGICFGFLLAIFFVLTVPERTGKATQVGIQYGDHSWEPEVYLGVREPGRQYTYFVRVKLTEPIERSLVTNCEIEKVEMTEREWWEWRTDDVDSWGRQSRKR